MTVAQVIKQLQDLVEARPEAAAFDFALEGERVVYGCRGLSVAEDETVVYGRIEPGTHPPRAFEGALGDLSLL